MTIYWINILSRTDLCIFYWYIYQLSYLFFVQTIYCAWSNYSAVSILCVLTLCVLIECCMLEVIVVISFFYAPFNRYEYANVNPYNAELFLHKEFFFILSMEGPSSDVKIWRLQTSDCDV